MELNNVQIKMMNDIENGKNELPRTHNELHSLISSIILAVDIDAIEKPFLERCKAQITRTYFSETEWLSGERVYLSSIKNRLSRRVYFQTFKTICAGRNADAFKESYRSLIKDGYAKSDGMFFTMNESARELLKKGESNEL